MRFLILCFAVVIVSSCASIVSKSVYPVNITANPNDANVRITDLNGMEIYNGSLPAVVQLEASAKFFKKQQYSLTFSAPGYESKTIPLLCKVDGWYWGNLLFGGIIGMLIVDPATGAMYKFHQQAISTTLQKEETSSLVIRTIDDLTALQRTQLVLVSNLSEL